MGYSKPQTFQELTLFAPFVSRTVGIVVWVWRGLVVMYPKNSLVAMASRLFVVSLLSVRPVRGSMRIAFSYPHFLGKEGLVAFGNGLGWLWCTVKVAPRDFKYISFSSPWSSTKGPCKSALDTFAIGSSQLAYLPSSVMTFQVRVSGSWQGFPLPGSASLSPLRTHFPDWKWPTHWPGAQW